MLYEVITVQRNLPSILYLFFNIGFVTGVFLWPAPPARGGAKKERTKMLKDKSLIAPSDFTLEEIEELLRLAERIIQKPERYAA